MRNPGRIMMPTKAIIKSTARLFADLMGVVTRKGYTKTLPSGVVRSLEVADASGTAVELNLWGDAAVRKFLLKSHVA